MARKAQKKQIPQSGKAYIVTGFNNTIVTLTDIDGNALFSGSAGGVGFKGSRKPTPYAATKAVEATAKQAYEAGLKEVAVLVKGAGAGRVAGIKALKTAGLRVTAISDITPVPHNGCRPKHKRKV
jgi:small subunit ribosomal protein S11